MRCARVLLCLLFAERERQYKRNEERKKKSRVNGRDLFNERETEARVIAYCVCVCMVSVNVATQSSPFRLVLVLLLSLIRWFPVSLGACLRDSTLSFISDRFVFSVLHKSVSVSVSMRARMFQNIHFHWKNAILICIVCIFRMDAVEQQWVGANVFVCVDQHGFEMEIRFLPTRCQIGHGHGSHHLPAVARHFLEISECIGWSATEFGAWVSAILSRSVQQGRTGTGRQSQTLLRGKIEWKWREYRARGAPLSYRGE